MRSLNTSQSLLKMAIRLSPAGAEAKASYNPAVPFIHYYADMFPFVHDIMEMLVTKALQSKVGNSDHYASECVAEIQQRISDLSDEECLRMLLAVEASIETIEAIAGAAGSLALKRYIDTGKVKHND